MAKRKGLFDIDPKDLSKKLEGEGEKFRQLAQDGAHTLGKVKFGEVPRESIASMSREAIDRISATLDSSYDPNDYSEEAARQRLYDIKDGRTPQPAAAAGAVPEPAISILDVYKQPAVAPAPPAGPSKGTLDRLERQVKLGAAKSSEYEERMRELAEAKAELEIKLADAQVEVGELSESGQTLRDTVSRLTSERSELNHQLAGVDGQAKEIAATHQQYNDLTGRMLIALSREEYDTFYLTADQIVDLSQPGSPAFIVEAAKTAGILKSAVKEIRDKSDELSKAEDEVKGEQREKRESIEERDERLKAYGDAIDGLLSVANAVRNGKLDLAGMQVKNLEEAKDLSDKIGGTDLGRLINAGSKLVELSESAEKRSKYFTDVQRHTTNSLKCLTDGNIRAARLEIRAIFIEQGSIVQDTVDGLNGLLHKLEDIYEKLEGHEGYQAAADERAYKTSDAYNKWKEARRELREKNKEIAKVQRELALLRGEEPEPEIEREGAWARAEGYLGCVGDRIRLAWYSATRRLPAVLKLKANDLDYERKERIATARLLFNHSVDEQDVGDASPSQVKAAEVHLREERRLANNDYVRGLQILYQM